MGVSIDTVYQRVLSILNKEQRGYVTPQEFNLFANQAQLDLFEQYFYDINQFNRMPGNSTEYSDMISLLEEKIALFETKANLVYNLPNAVYPLPADLYRVGSVVYKNTTTRDLLPSPTQIANYPLNNPEIYRETNEELIEAEKITAKDYLYINSSPLTKPKNTRPIYVAKDSGINVYGESELKADVSLHYIKKPARVEWAYQIVYGESLFDATFAVDFELHPSEETELVIKILELAGISTRSMDVYQVAAQEEAKNTQQEKS